MLKACEGHMSGLTLGMLTDYKMLLMVKRRERQKELTRAGMEVLRPFSKGVNPPEIGNTDVAVG
jgi:hypothetical protein